MYQPYIPQYQPYNYSKPYTFQSSLADIQNAGKYYNQGWLGIGQGFDVNSALANGVSPQAMADYQYLQGMQGGIGLNEIGTGLMLGSSLVNTYLNWSNISTQNDLLNEQIKIAKMQEQAFQDEQARVKNVRSKLAQIY